jgi:glycerol-3-phosphate O-acyltransferase
VTPGSLTALVLLTHRQRGLSHEDLLARAERVLGVLKCMGARTSPALCTESGALRRDSIREAVQMFADTELVTIHLPAQGTDGRRSDAVAGPGAHYVVEEEKRLSLDASKNAIIHFFVERALVALALLSSDDCTTDAVRERVRALSRLFKLEFRFRADQAFEAIFEDTRRSMADALEIETKGDRYVPGPGHDGSSGREWLELYANIVVSFLEAYRIAARGLLALERGPLGEKELVKKTLGLGKEMFLAGEIERREAVSKPTLRNAFQAFAEQGFVLHRENYLLAPDYVGPDAVRGIEAQIASYFPRGSA